MHGKRMLVTGASGMVGRHVVRKAVEHGYEVRAFVKTGNSAAPIQDLGIDIVYGDLTEPDCIPAALEGMHVVVHAAGLVGDWGPLADYQAINQDAVESLLSAIRQRGGIERVVHISSLAAR